MMQFCDLKKQYQLHKSEIDAAIHSVLDSGLYIMGPQVASLEKTLADYVGVKECITVSSGTDSLLIALMALGIGPGDEVITVPFTWISSAEVIALAHAKPVFVDIDLETFNMDVDQLEAAITPRTRAIIPVSLFGQMPNYQQINQIAAKYKLAVIEDAAQSFGATQQEKMSCGVTLVGSTSFFPAKPFGCYGDGGALFTNDSLLAEKMRAIRIHGGPRHEARYVGLNGRFDTIQAAILLAKFPYYAKEIQRRQEIGARYSKELAQCCVTPKVAKGNSHIYSQYTIRVSNRKALGEALKAKGIPSAIYYPKCLHEEEVFAPLGYKKGDFPAAEKAALEVISLPVHPWLTDAECDLIIKEVQAAAFPAVPAKKTRGAMQATLKGC